MTMTQDALARRETARMGEHDRPKRRTFTAEYKLAVLEEADACIERGEIGALLRREGLYKSHLVDWRRARREGTLAGLEAKTRQPGPSADQREIKRLRRRNAQLEADVVKFKALVDLAGKAHAVLEILSAETAASDAASSQS